MDLRKQPDLEDRLEACRPDSHDTDFHDIGQEPMQEAAAALRADPDLARQFEQQQQYDTAVSHAMHQVQAPAGLADRILARLAESTAAEATDDDQLAAPLPLDKEFSAAEFAAAEAVAAAALAAEHDSTTATVAPPKPAQRPAASRLTRRRMIGAVAALAASLLLAVMLGQWWLGSTHVVSTEQFRKQALRWRELVKTDDWQADLAEFRALEAKYPLQKHMRVGPSGYQRVDPQLSDADEMAVYDFSTQRGSAYLFVAQTECTTPSMIAGSPPSESAALTAGWSMAAWREGPLLYVLLHKGGAHQYDQLIESPSAIALHFSRDDSLRGLASR